VVTLKESRQLTDWPSWLAGKLPLVSPTEGRKPPGPSRKAR